MCLYVFRLQYTFYPIYIYIIDNLLKHVRQPNYAYGFHHIEIEPPWGTYDIE